MSQPQKSKIFLEHAGYRQRRLRDAARLLPLLGAVLWAVPLLWQSDAPEGENSSGALVYVFVVWAILIGLSFLISRLIRADDGSAPKDSTP